MENGKLEKELKKCFKNAEVIYLFGSFANNTFNKNSDIDIACFIKTN